MDRRMIICLLIALQGLVVVQGFMPFSHRSNMRSTRYHAAESTATFSSEKPLKVLLIVEPTPFNYVSGKILDVVSLYLKKETFRRYSFSTPLHSPPLLPSAPSLLPSTPLYSNLLLCPYCDLLSFHILINRVC